MKKHKRKYLHQFDSPYGQFKPEVTAAIGHRSTREIAEAMADQRLALLREVMSERATEAQEGRK